MFLNTLHTCIILLTFTNNAFQNGPWNDPQTAYLRKYPQETDPKMIKNGSDASKLAQHLKTLENVETPLKIIREVLTK